jgi:hypothetical protein
MRYSQLIFVILAAWLGEKTEAKKINEHNFIRTATASTTKQLEDFFSLNGAKFERLTTYAQFSATEDPLYFTYPTRRSRTPWTRPWNLASNSIEPSEAEATTTASNFEDEFVWEDNVSSINLTSIELVAIGDQNNELENLIETTTKKSKKKHHSTITTTESTSKIVSTLLMSSTTTTTITSSTQQQATTPSTSTLQPQTSATIEFSVITENIITTTTTSQTATTNTVSQKKIGEKKSSASGLKNSIFIVLFSFFLLVLDFNFFIL